MADKIYLSVDQSFHVPSEVKPGDDFNAVATLRLEDDGKTLCLRDIEGSSVQLADKKQEKKEPTGFLDAVESGMGDSNAPAQSY